MRRHLLCAVAGLTLAWASLSAEEPAVYPYRVEVVDKVLAATREENGKKALYVTVQFQIVRTTDGKPVLDVGKNEIRVKEEGKPVAEMTIYRPRGADPLTAVLALDVSGSMINNHKIEQARQAAGTFLDQLDPRADCGLILFNHELRQPTIGPLKDRDPKAQASHRNAIRKLVNDTRPSGGTANLDATAEAIAMLREVRGRRAVIVMTDGVDLNSKHSLDEVVEMAQAAETPVYTIGVGEPGKNEPVTTVLVLDRSGSMRDPADNKDKISKINALHIAASRFVEIMRPGARTTIMAFSDTIDKPDPFSSNKPALKGKINKLEARGETALFDAIFQALQTLEAERAPGKKAVIVLTDGMDNRSGHRVEEVIERAQRMETPLHLLGLGRDKELDQDVMRLMARETHGTYHHAENQQKLYEIFEDLSIQLHDEGVDEKSLRRLADETGGRYVPAHDVSQLEFRFKELAEQLQSTYTVTFPSVRTTNDGTARGIDIQVFRNGVPLSGETRVDYTVPGVVVPDFDPPVYAVFLAILGGLLALPAGMRRLYRFYGGT
jgi:VWFA-related protein